MESYKLKAALDMPKQTIPQSADAAARTIVIRNPEANLPTIYCNQIGIVTTSWDITLLFNEQVESDNAEQILVDRKAKVVMSPQHAKALVAILADNVKKYEEQVGPIPWPPLQLQAK